jgi:hypothetical protein
MGGKESCAVKPGKLPSELTVEELEHLATNSDSMDNLQEDIFFLFISTFNLTSGQYKVHADILFKLFRAWSKTFLNKRSFLAKLALLFERDGRFFLLSKSSMVYINSIATLEHKEHQKKISNMTRRKRMEKFLKDYNIKRGKLWVSAHTLHYLYDKWRANRRLRGQLGYFTFVAFLRLYLQDTQTRYGVHFKVNESIRKLLTERELAQVRQVQESERAKKENTPRRRKIPSIKTRP